MTHRCGVADVNVNRSVSVRNEAGTIADAVTVDRVRHKMIARIAQGERPKCIVRRKLSRLKVHDVVVVTGELLTSAIGGRRPIHCLLRDVDGARKSLGAGGSDKNAVTRRAASVHGGPTIHRRDIGVRDNLKRDERQYTTGDDALDDVCDNRPFNQEVR
jgi:hypothetical protein